MTRPVLLLIAFSLLLYAAPTDAKPLITHSERTLVSTCIDYDDTNARLLHICSAALNEPGLTDRKRAHILTAHADALSWLNRHDEARLKYHAALSADPSFADAHEGLGWVHWVEDDHAAAAENFETALDLAPSSDALGGLASAQLEMGALTVREAITLYDAALAIEPENRWVLRQKGWAQIKDDQFDAARVTFQAAVDLKAQDAEALEGLAIAHYHLDEDEEALRLINAAIAAAPDTPGYTQRRSMILLALDRPAAALRDAQAYLQERPDSAIGYVREGRALDALGQTETALSSMASARERLPRDDMLDYWYAMTLSDDGRNADAWDVMSYHLTDQSGGFWDYVLLAFLAVETDQLSAAQDAVGHLRTLRPNNYYTHYWDAVTRVYHQDIDGAEAQIRRALQQGMGEGLLADFVEHMVGQGYFVRATALRLDLRKATLAQE